MNIIHPTAIIEDSVSMGVGNYVGPYCYLAGNTKIGDNNRFEAYCSIGTNPEHIKYMRIPGKTQIGDDNIIREFVTINAGIAATIVFNKCLLLRGSHVGHDAVLQDQVTLSCNALVGGHSILFKGSNMGLAAVCHQYSRIGHYSMIGMNSTVTKKSIIKPGVIYAGSPVRAFQDNKLGLNRDGITGDDMLNYLEEWKATFRGDIQ